MLSLSNIKPSKGVIKKTKRVGRGNASGHGTYSCRGMKGQKARSGVSGLKKFGLKQLIFKLPKKRGFTSKKPKNQVVNLETLNLHYKENEIVTPESLISKGLAKKNIAKIKILGEGKLEVKGLQFKGLRFSQKAKVVKK